MSLSEVLTGFVPLVALITLPLTLLISWILLRFYRWSVIRLMSSISMSDTAPTPKTHGSPPSSPLKLHVNTSSSASLFSPAVKSLYSKLRRKPWQISLVYLAAGTICILFVTVGFLISDQTEILPLPFTFAFLAYIWPIVPTFWVTAADRFQIQILITGIYALIFLTLGAIITITSSTFKLGMIIILWDTINSHATIALLIVLNRRVRAIAPLVLITLILGISGSLGMFEVIAELDALRYYLFGFLTANQLIGLCYILGFLALGAIGWLTLIWIRNRYREQKISDQSLIVDSIWLLFFVQFLIYFSFRGIAWVLYGIAMFLIFKIIAWGGFALMKQRFASEEKPIDLLLLRVFSLGVRSQRLYDAIGTHWRPIGHLRLIAGPDLATSTIEPHEFLDFMSGKLRHRFIDSPETLNKRIAEMPRNPDHDGRYRVTEFFCYANMWKTVLARLATEHDAVLMDLRGFSAENAGCVFEINALIDLVPLENIVFITDRTTDEAFLSQALKQAWNDMVLDSPNREGQNQARIFRFRHDNLQDFPALLKQISLAATSS